jgi:hypothetical protein
MRHTLGTPGLDVETWDTMILQEQIQPTRFRN